MPQQIDIPAPATPRQRILDAATAVFAERGFGGARVDEIALRAGVNKAMVYYYIGEKDVLFATVLSDIQDRVLASLAASSAPDRPASDRLRIVVRVLAGTAASDPHMAPLLLHTVASGGEGIPDPIVEKLARIFAFVGEILDAGHKSGEFRAADALMTHATIVGSIMFLIASLPLRRRIAETRGSRDHVEPSVDALIDHVSSIILDGLVPKPHSRSKTPRRPPASTGGSRR